MKSVILFSALLLSFSAFSPFSFAGSNKQSKDSSSESALPTVKAEYQYKPCTENALSTSHSETGNCPTALSRKHPTGKAIRLARNIYTSIEKVANRAGHIVLNLDNMLAQAFKSRVHIASHQDGSHQTIITFDLPASFANLHLNEGIMPLTSYSELYPAWQLQQMNPELWDRLSISGQESIQTGQSDLSTARYTLEVDALRNKLALEENDPQLPYVDVYLKDKNGDDFSLSELPFEWLQFPQIVDALEACNDRNKAESLRQLGAGISIARFIYHLIAQQNDEPSLKKYLKLADSSAIPLDAYQYNNQDFIETCLTESDTASMLDILCRSKRLPVKEEHLKTCLGKRQRGRNAAGQVRQLVQNLESVPSLNTTDPNNHERKMSLSPNHEDTAKARNSATFIAKVPGFLVDFALNHDADKLVMVQLLDLNNTEHTPHVDVEHLLTFLDRPSNMYNDEQASQEPGIALKLILLLKNQGVSLTEYKTEHGDLVDYALTSLPALVTLKILYNEAEIKASVSHLIKAIDCTTRGGDKALPLRVIRALQAQGFDLKSWRNEAGETLAEYGYRVGVPKFTLSTLYYLRHTDTLPPQSFFDNLDPKARSITSPFAKATNKTTKGLDTSSWQYHELTQQLKDAFQDHQR